MARSTASLIAIAAIACGACGARSPRPPMPAAGSDSDDGDGLLARASSRLMTDDEVEPNLFPTTHARNRHIRRDDDGNRDASAIDGAIDDAEGSGAYGGTNYATYVVPPWSYPAANRTVRYTQKVGLTAAIEGVVSWRGAPPPKLTTSCGVVESLRVGSDHGVGGVLVYIEHVSIGRALLHDGGDRRPSTVGGVIVKRGCALVPTVQVVTPLPAPLAIHGDAKPARLVITAPAPATAKLLDLEEGGRIELQARPGITHVIADDGALGAAWVVALDSPYYAITDDSGRFRLDELAAGTYEVTFWQPPIATLAAGRLTYGPPIVVRRTIKVDAAKSARLDLTLALGR